MSHQTAVMFCHQGMRHLDHYSCGTEQARMPLYETWVQEACVLQLHRTNNNACYHCTRLTGIPGTAGMHKASVQVLYTCTRPLLPLGQQASLPLQMFVNVAQDQHTCLLPRLQTSRYVCNNFTRLVGVL